MVKEKKSEKRRRQIMGLIEKGLTNVADIASQLGVSDMTIRRDLNALELKGLVIRKYGGAVKKETVKFEFDILERMNLNKEQKQGIARKAVSLIRSGDTVFLDTGTTTLCIAREIAESGLAVTVITTSILIGYHLSKGKSSVILTGGLLKQGFPDLYGPIAEEAIKKFHADTLFIGCDGFVPQEGFYTSDVTIRPLNRAMISCAERKIVVADASKFGKRSLTLYADTGEMDMIITDDSVDTSFLDSLSGIIEVVTVSDYMT